MFREHVCERQVPGHVVGRIAVSRPLASKQSLLVGALSMQRQLAAVLCADVAGYSRLTRQDEERTHRKLNDGLDLLSATITAHGGQKVHEAGDAILTEFASVTDAVETAAAFQREMGRRNSGLADATRIGHP